MLEFTNIYPMDAVYDTPEDVPEDVSLSFDSMLCYHCLPFLIGSAELIQIEPVICVSTAFCVQTQTK